jgi:hypothetical protein
MLPPILCTYKSRLGITTVVSTDHIRQLARCFVPPTHILNHSSYNIVPASSSDVLQSESLSSEEIIRAYEEQTDALYPNILKLVQYHLECNNCLILEGVHLSTKIIQRLLQDNPKQCAHIIPFIIYISNKVKHSERFAIRAKYMTLEPRRNKYIHYFQNIRTIQNHLITAPIQLSDSLNMDNDIDSHNNNINENNDEMLQLPRVDNTNVDKSIVLIHQTILKYLIPQHLKTTSECRKESASANLKLLNYSFEEILKVNNLGSKEMLQQIQKRKGHAGDGTQQDRDIQREVELVFQQISDDQPIGSLGS